MDIHLITLKGNSLSTQHIYGQSGKNRYMLPKASLLKRSYQIQARSQRRGKKPLEEDLFVFINIYFGAKYRHDRDNFHKLSCDALEGIVLQNDSQIRLALVEKSYDKQNPRQEIYICSYENRNQLIDYYLTTHCQNLSL